VSDESIFGADRKPRVRAEQCSTCIGRPGNLMKLRPGRVRRMVQDALNGGSVIVCHQTLSYGGHPELGGPAVCRWFYDTYGHLSNVCRVYERLGGFTEVEVPQDEDGSREGE